MGTKITVDEMCRQWRRNGQPSSLVSHFSYQTFQFAQKAGEISRDYFRNSFSVGGFDGKRWSERQSAWGKKFTHPLMLDTQTLKNSIQMETYERNRGSNIATHAKKFGKRGAIAKIWTNESNPPMKGKRGRSASYAAVHNTDPKFGLYTVNQHSSKRPEHRQFIGFSTQVDNEIAKHIDMIFDGLPI